jgi:hypothetical protein
MKKTCTDIVPFLYTIKHGMGPTSPRAMLYLAKQKGWFSKDALGFETLGISKMGTKILKNSENRVPALFGGLPNNIQSKLNLFSSFSLS